MPAVDVADYLRRKRATWQRTPGNPYASDTTYEVAVVLASNRRCWELVEQRGLRNADGKLDGEAFKAVFEPRLSDYRFTDIRLSQIDWQEVADEFANEVQQERPARQEAPADAAGGADASTPGLAIAATQTPERPASMSEILVGDIDSPSRVKARAIDPAALEILRQCSSTEQGIFLPMGQLDRKLYDAVNAVLVALGGKWDRRLKGHRFQEDPRAVLALAVDTGLFLSPKDFGFFPTPQEVGRRLIMAADLEPGMVVLEPSAGQGALADLAAEVVGKDNVHTIEMLASNRRVLGDKGYVVYGVDFLATKPRPLFDRVVMNPPFENMADVEHISHALRFLRPDGKLVAIAAPSFLHRETAKARAFRSLLDMAGEVVENVPAGAFKESGTNVSTVILSMDASRLPAEFFPEREPGDEAESTEPQHQARDRMGRQGAGA